MDYVVGSIAALVSSGNVTPNRPRLNKKAATPTKHPTSPNITPKSELVDRSIFLSPSLQKKKEVVKKSPKRIFQNEDLDSTNNAQQNLVKEQNAKRIKKQLENQLDGEAGASSQDDTVPEAQTDDAEAETSKKKSGKKNKKYKNAESENNLSNSESNTELNSPIVDKENKASETKSNKKSKKRNKKNKSKQLLETTEPERENKDNSNQKPTSNDVEMVTTESSSKKKNKKKNSKQTNSESEIKSESSLEVMKQDDSNKKPTSNDVEMVTTESVSKKKNKNKKLSISESTETKSEQVDKDTSPSENQLIKKSKKKNKNLQKDNHEEESKNKKSKVNPNAIAQNDTDSEHESDNEIHSETEEQNEEVLKQDSSSEDEEEKEQKQKEVKKPEKKEINTEDDVKRTLFVGNVPFSKKCKKEIKRIFNKYGTIDSVRIRAVPIKDPKQTPKLAVIKNEIHPDRTTVNVYVKYAEASSVEAALVENNTELNGNHLRVTKSDSSGALHDPKCSIFVGNLPFTIEDETLRNVFSKCGEIESVRVIRDKKTNAGKGFGYVNFTSKDGVELALSLKEEELTIRNRIIRVKRCLTTNKPKKQAKPEKFVSKDQGAMRRINNKRQNQIDSRDGAPPNKKMNLNQPQKDKKQKKEFVGTTSEKKKKRNFNKNDKKNKKISEIMTKK